MPRKTKETTENEKIDKPTKRTTKKATNKKTDTKKAETKKTSTKKSTVKEAKTTKKSSSSKKETTKKTTAKKTTTKKTSTPRTKKTKKEEVLTNLEYYDLPYRYNQTIVKILAQTPNTLFVYWDIADEDRKKLEETYGNEFFTNTKPVLIIHNETKNYTFEVEINDFANSWYLHLNDTDCKYNIELGRIFKNIPSNNENNNNYIYICSSNNIITPNDHILFNYSNQVEFKNVKTNTIFLKEIKNMKFILDKENYNKFYSNDFSNEFLRNNPTSNVKK